MIRAALCDFDGVIRLWQPDGAARIEADHGLPAGALAAAAFRPELLQPATTGAITDEDWREQIAAAVAAEHGEAARAAVAAWNGLTGDLDAQMLELVREVRRIVPVVLLTNATTRLPRDLAELGLEDAFDAVANSSELGVAKPDPAMFERAAALVGLPLGECVVVDDQPGHVDAARAAGASAILHRGVTETRSELAALGLL